MAYTGSVTPREKWLALFKGGGSGEPVCDYWATPEVTRRLLGELGCSTERELYEKLGIAKGVFLAPRHPRAREDTWHTASLYSIWGIPTREVPYLGGAGCYEEAVDPPLACATSVREIERYPWPEASEWETAEFRRECEAWRDYAIIGANYEPFYLYCRLRGMEQALEDLLTNPSMVDAAMERIFEIHAGIVRKAMEAAGDLITFICVAEDLGTQYGLLMSLSCFRRSIKPWLKRMIDLAHSLGALVFHHNDGAIRPLLPELVEMGIDLLNPVQWRCPGMDRKKLVEEFGAHLVFHGAVDNQITLPFGAPEDVQREVRENLEIFSRARGYIVAPCHNIQANTPTGNILALYEAVAEWRGA